MDRRNRRRAATSLLAACLFVAALTWFWPAEEFPRLDRVAPQKKSTQESYATAAFQAPESERLPSETIEEPLAEGDHPEDLRDAVAPIANTTPHLRGGSAAPWLQAPWRAYWREPSGKKLEIPVPQKAPAVFQRGANEHGIAVKPPSSRWQNQPQTPSHETPRTKPWSSALAASWLTPSAVARAMQRAGAALKNFIADHGPGRTRFGGSPPFSGRNSAWENAKPLKGEPEPPEPKIKKEKKEKRPPKFKPLLLSQLLGKNAIRPPRTDVRPPDMSRLQAEAPTSGPDGRPLAWPAASLDAVEAVRPPSESCQRTDGHWHDGIYHDQKAWASQSKDGWLWQEKSDGHWWAFTEPSQPTWLWSNGHWWWKSEGVWFLLHQGEAWGYRLFNEERAEGLIHPATGTRMLYSKDGSRVALITPGEGAWLFDAQTGKTLRRWSEEQMPAPRRPRAPAAISLP